MTKLLFFLGNYKKFPTLYSQRFLTSFTLAIIPVFQLFSQQLEVKGKIFEENSKITVIGASIKVKNQQGGTVTDVNGNFSLKVKSFPVTLGITSIGYKNQEIDIYDNEPVTIYLTENSNKLSEVVVVGYGTQKRKELTGAISTVSKSHLEYNVSSSVDALLGGAVAGVNVTQSSGQPGSPASIRIRGGNSINASNNPLYVIDGFPYFSDNSTTKVGLGAVEG